MEKTGSSIHRKASAHQHKAEVRIAGEQLRLRLHDCKLIKDRRYHLRTYPNCFVAQELIDWLIAHKEAPDRSSAVRVMQYLMDHDIVHHGSKMNRVDWIGGFNQDSFIEIFRDCDLGCLCATCGGSSLHAERTSPQSYQCCSLLEHHGQDCCAVHSANASTTEHKSMSEGVNF